MFFVLALQVSLIYNSLGIAQGVRVIGRGGTILALSTTMPLLIHSLSTGFPLGVSLLALLGVIYVGIRLHKDFPGKVLIERLRAENAELAGMVADLGERFTRFQKREGMRDARSAKERESDVLAQAQQIAAQSASDEAPNDKTALYRRARRMQ